MYRPDIDRFDSLMHQLGEAFDKLVTPKQVELYWAALKDLPWEIVEQCGQNHMRYGKFFPKASELRPKADKPPEPTDYQGLDAAERANVAAWEELRRLDPRRYWLEFERAYLGRLDFRFLPGSPEHTTAAQRCKDRCAQELFMLERIPERNEVFF